MTKSLGTAREESHGNSAYVDNEAASPGRTEPRYG
ncbi:hypothetical protein ABIE00_001029 [Arthrobacter sp. OAP107]